MSDQEAAGSRVRDLPEWLEEFTENLEDTEVSASDHVEPRVQLYVPKEETLSISLKYVDVTRTMHTKVDVLQESHISRLLTVDVDRNLSDSWTGFTMFTLVNEKLPKAYMSSGVAAFKDSSNCQT